MKVESKDGKPVKSELKNAQSLEMQRREALEKKGNASAVGNIKALLSKKNKEIDPEKKKAASRLLRSILCE